MTLSRREMLKAQAAGVAALAANMSVPANAQPVTGGVDSLQIKWSKAPCRFCGTGCGVMVGVKEGKVIATHGDMKADVNRGLNCIKGYFLSKIMYGNDRLTQPLLRKKNGVYAKDGEFTPVSWAEAFDTMAAKAKATLKAKGPTALGMFGSGQWTIFEGYAATKLMRAGFRSNNLDPNARVEPVPAWRRFAHLRSLSPSVPRRAAVARSRGGQCRGARRERPRERGFSSRTRPRPCCPWSAPRCASCRHVLRPSSDRLSNACHIAVHRQLQQFSLVPSGRPVRLPGRDRPWLDSGIGRHGGNPA